MITVKVGGAYKKATLSVKVLGKYRAAKRTWTKVADVWRTSSFGAGFDPVLGELFAGGIVVGFKTYGIVRHALIASVIGDQSTGTMFNNGNAWLAATNVDDGRANTANLFDARFLAAKFCTAYRGGGYDDWYLPAINELVVAYNSQKVVFSATNYLASNQSSSTSPRIINMGNGKKSTTNNTSLRYVRPFRRVPIG